MGAFSPFLLLGGLITLVFVVLLFLWYFYVIACLFAVILSTCGFRGSLYLFLYILCKLGCLDLSSV